MLTVSQPFTQAVSFLADKTPKGSPFSSAQWTAQGADITTKAFFSAGIENTRFLQRGQTLLDDFLTKSVEEVTDSKGVTSTKLKVGSRADFVREMRVFMLENGMATESDFKGSQTDIKNITKLSRLQLIFDTNIRQSFGYGRWKQGMRPAVLDAFPASRFVRLPGSVMKRPRHLASEGEVRLKTDLAYWANYQNGADIGGFEVPYAPFGFNSNMTTRDVTRKAAERLGLIKKGERITQAEPERLTDKVQADLEDVDPAIVDQFEKYIANKKRIQIAPMKLLPPIVDKKPSPAPPTTRPAPRPSIPLAVGLTAFILPSIIPEITLNGDKFVFILGQWRSLTGSSSDAAKLNQFTDDATMLDEIKKEFGDSVSF
jgi:hypothetical protein